jgi:hypothetical protein
MDRLVDKIHQEVNEETSSASIAYLPGAFTSTKAMVGDLSRIKKLWDITVLESEAGYEVTFEDALKVTVPKAYYDDFNTKVAKVHGLTKIDLTKLINEAIKEVEETSYERLYNALAKDLRKSKNVMATMALMNHWLHTFPTSKFVQSEEKVAIRANDFDNDVKKLVGEIRKLYGEDLGNVDILVDAIESGKALGAIENYDYLVGIKIQSVYEGTNLILEMQINTSMIPSQSIYVDTIGVMDELENYRTVKALYRKVFPVGQMFEPSIFGNIKDIIDDIKE